MKRLTRGRSAVPPAATILGAFVVALAPGLLSPAEACSTAGCPLVTQNPDGSKPKGSFTLDLSFRAMTQDTLLGVRAGEARATGALIDFENGRLLPGHHQDAVMRHRLAEATLSYGLATRVTVFATLPFWNARRHDQRDLVQNFGVPHTLHEAPAADDVSLASSPTRHEQTGLGDLQVGAGVLLAGGPKRSVFARVSVKAPTGSHTKPDPYGFVDRPDLQPGSGSWDGIASVTAQRRWKDSTWSIFGGAYGRLNGTSDGDYRFGHEASLALGLTSGRVGRIRPSIQVGYRVTSSDRFLGREVPSTGMRSWTLTPGVRVRANSGTALYAFAKLPIATSVNGTQLAPRIDVLAGVSRSF